MLPGRFSCRTVLTALQCVSMIDKAVSCSDIPAGPWLATTTAIQNLYKKTRKEPALLICTVKLFVSYQFCCLLLRSVSITSMPFLEAKGRTCPYVRRSSLTYYSLNTGPVHQLFRALYSCTFFMVFHTAKAGGIKLPKQIRLTTS